MTITFTHTTSHPSNIDQTRFHDEEHSITFKKRADGWWDVQARENGVACTPGCKVSAKKAARMAAGLKRRGYVKHIG